MSDGDREGSDYRRGHDNSRKKREMLIHPLVMGEGEEEALALASGTALIWGSVSKGCSSHADCARAQPLWQRLSCLPNPLPHRGESHTPFSSSLVLRCHHMAEL